MYVHVYTFTLSAEIVAKFLYFKTKAKCLIFMMSMTFYWNFSH